jgi:hexulose-6-phosphate isomerase
MAIATSSRRTFFKHAAILGTAAAFPVFAEDKPASSPKRSIHKGIMYATIGVKGSVLEKFQQCKTAGFEGVEAMSGMNQDEVLEARDSTGLKVPSVCCSTHWDKPLSSPDESVRQAGLKGLEQALRDAHKYGARSVLFVPGVVNQQISYDQCYKRSQEGIRKLLPLAQELKVKIAIENVWNHFLLSPLEAARYIDEFESPWIGWHFDVGNIITYGWPEQWIRILNKRIVTLHIKEFSREKANNQGLWKGFDVEFLKGSNNWPVVMKAIDEIGFDGWGISEQPGAGSPEGLKKLSDEMTQIFAS